MQIMKRRLHLLSFLFLYLCSHNVVFCVTLNGELFVNDLHLLCRMANFNQNDKAKISGTLVVAPKENPLLCSNSQAHDVFQSNIVLVPRGNCSFQQKALVAMENGAVGMIVYNTLESRYEWNETHVEYPKNKIDYECANGGKATIAANKNKFQLDPPRYSTKTHDEFLTLTNPNNLCQLDNQTLCESQRCLVTGKKDNNDEYTACCAWDLHISMGKDDDMNQNQFKEYSDFVSMFCTMRQGAILSEREQEQVTIQTRSYSEFNVSSVLLWLLAIAVVTISALYSVRDYRKAYRMLERYMDNVRLSVLQRGSASLPALPSIPHQEEATVAESSQGSSQENEEEQEERAILVEEEPSTTEESPSEEFLLSSPPGSTSLKSDVKPTGEATEAFDDEHESLGDEEQQLEEPSPQQDLMASSEASPSDVPEATTSTNSAPSSSSSRPATTPPTTNSSFQSSEVLELTVWHAVAFVLVASSILFLLFYFEFYSAVAVLYAIGCSGAVAHLIFYPVYNAIKFLRGPFLCIKRFQTSFTWAVFFALVSAYSLAAVWLYVGFTADNPSTNNVFFWLTQNLMASCACIMFLSVIRLSSIKVATALLMAAFIYDIFFVFITPYLFNGESIMVTVATSGGAANGSESDENFCEKYPDDGDCQGGTILPLVFTIPRIDDYRGGSTLLGLGDLILPGLLIAFSARLDQAKRLSVLAGMGESVTKPPTKWYHGYLFPLLVAYAIGLMMAYVAVRLMERGQPALLYIVPCCLGTTIVVGRHELSKLWAGPPELQWANNLVTYCDRNATRLTASPETIAASSTGGTSAPSPQHTIEEHQSRSSTRSLT